MHKHPPLSLIPRLLPSFLVCDKKLGRSLGTRLPSPHITFSSLLQQYHTYTHTHLLVLSLQLLQALLCDEDVLLKLLLAPPQLCHPPHTLLQLGGEVCHLLQKLNSRYINYIEANVHTCTVNEATLPSHHLFIPNITHTHLLMLSLQLLQALLCDEDVLLKLLLAPPQLCHPPHTLLQLGGEVCHLLQNHILLPSQSMKLKGRERERGRGGGERRRRHWSLVQLARLASTCIYVYSSPLSPYLRLSLCELHFQLC